MSVFWVAALIVVCLFAIRTFAARRRRGDAAGLESVSERWLAEQRATDRHYSER